MQYPYISMYSRSKPASTHSTALDATVGERSRKQKISDLRTSPGPLWRLHTWFDPFSLPTRSAAGSRVDDDRRCRSPQLGFTTSQPRGCIPSSAPQTALREAVEQPSGRCREQPSGRVAHIRCQLSGRASPSRTSSCRNPDSLTALRNYFAGREREARSCMALVCEKE